MRMPVSNRKLKLKEICGSYLFLGTDGYELKNGAPEEAKIAFAELKKIIEEEWKHYLDPDWF